MQTVSVGSTVRIGNHALTAEEVTAGLTPRDPFVDEDGAPVDPGSAWLDVRAPTGDVYRFAWPTAGPTDTGPLEQESTGRFYADVTPGALEDGGWAWMLGAAMAFGSGLTDQDVFYTKRPVVPGV